MRGSSSWAASNQTSIPTGHPDRDAPRVTKEFLMGQRSYLPIFFTTVSLLKQVYIMGGGFGFTTVFYKYVCAASKEEAEALVYQWATAQGCEVKAVTADSLAVDQNVSTYTFPHQIINMPQQVLDDEYDRRKYPISYRDPGQQVRLSDSTH
jgi:hypothetical protein